MSSRNKLFLAIIGSSLILAPTLFADDHGGGGGGGGSGGGGSGSGSGGGGGGSGSGGNGGSQGGNNSTAASLVRAAQRALKDAGDQAENVVKREKDLRVNAIFVLRSAGATADEVNAALADAIASVTALTGSGVQQIDTLKASLLAGLPSTATAGQRAAVEAAAASATSKLNKRLRSATQDLRRAASSNIPAGMRGEHPFPEHGPGHP